MARHLCKRLVRTGMDRTPSGSASSSMGDLTYNHIISSGLLALYANAFTYRAPRDNRDVMQRFGISSPPSPK